MKNQMTYIVPADQQTIEQGSMWDCYQQGLCSAGALNWAWLCGVDLFKFGDISLAVMSDAAFMDVGKDQRLCSALQAGPEAALHFVRDADNLKGLDAVRLLGRGARKALRGRAALALALEAVRNARLPCPAL